ncbi:FimV/HubP family polar landmark protein [Thalassotalea nanhaiensis]|uniref:FimV/HubP family polar landmark protein n=1 Tax=Thalassotalea nanhaiensis TaxID=3065648 RepID=A0ABY9TFG3_9GAMM|nr:FimV/HubP family polar landmark protein [Colwelliaceae bacterium SQ345]
MADNNNKSLFKTITQSICAAFILVSPLHAFAQDELVPVSDTSQNVNTSTASSALTDSENTSASSQNFDEDNKASYGPILTTDTLWKIAVAHRPDTTVSNYQVMMALFNTNPNAFLRNDINTMVAGQFLRIPTLEEIRQVAPYPYGNAQQAETAETVDVAKSELETTATADSTEAVESSENITVAAVADTEETVVVEALVEQSAASDVKELTTQTDAATVEVIEEEAVVTLKAENSELKESLNAVDDQLSYLQYEVAKATEMQAQMDDKLAEQNALLKEAKMREQKLLAQQRKLTEQQQGFFNNPMTYWSINGLLAILVIILFVLVSRRKKMEQTTSNIAVDPTAENTNEVEIKEQPTISIEESVKEPINEQAQAPVVVAEKSEQVSEIEQTEKVTATESTPTPSENEHVVTAFTSMDLTPEKQELEILDDKELLAKLVPGGVQDNRNEDNVKIQATEDDLDIEQIIDDMLEEESKPAKLRSARAPLDELVTPVESNDESLTINSAEEHETNSSEVHEINDFDDVEFDKLLAEISAESEHIKPPSNVTQLRRTTEVKARVEPEALDTATEEKLEKDFIAVDTLLEESALAEELDESVFDQHKIDVGLDEFPEFTSQVSHVNVDDDKHGVNAKLDLAQVYIEIGDLDNAAVILKSVMKLGNSGQQQQAQDLLYSIK